MEFRQHGAVPDPLSVSTDLADPARPVLAVTGELDFRSADLLRVELDQVFAGQPVLVVLDLTGLRFCDSTGLSLMVHAWQAARERGAEFEIRHIPPFLVPVLKITGVAELLEQGAGRKTAGPATASA